MDAERIERYAGLVDRFRTFQDGDRSRERWDVVGSMLVLEQDMTIDENLEAIDAAVSRGMTEDQIKDAATDATADVRDIRDDEVTPNDVDPAPSRFSGARSGILLCRASR